VLVNQHFEFFRKRLDLDGGAFAMLTGEEPPALRAPKWEAQVLFATPQVVLADHRRGYIPWEALGLVIFDEAHRAVGDHAYARLARELVQRNPQARRMGMTASVPDAPAVLDAILRALHLSGVEVRDEQSLEVHPYVQKTQIEWREVQLAPSLARLRGLLQGALRARAHVLADAGILSPGAAARASLRSLLEAQRRLREVGRRDLWGVLLTSVRLAHALNMLETQSLRAFVRFVQRLGSRGTGGALRMLLADRAIREAFSLAHRLLDEGTEHPKLNELVAALKGLKSGERALVFASFRDTVDIIAKHLTAQGLRVATLVGKRGMNGLSQAQQVEAVQALRAGRAEVLVATQVGEEGLDIAECSLVVFYDNVPSGVRFVQRRGRTGRQAPGRVILLITKNTRDEANYWMGRRRLGTAQRLVGDLARPRPVGPLDRFL
jgi:Fanconi anemia group M protein